MEGLRQGFLDVLSVILLFVVPAGLGIMVLAEPLVLVLLGAKWQAAVPLVQLLSVFGVLRATASNIGSIYLAIGMPKLVAYMTLVFLAVMGVGFLLWVPDHGAIGAAFAVLLAVSIQVPLNFSVVTKKIGLSISSLLSVMWRPLIGGLAMATALTFASHSAASLEVGHLVQLAVLIPCGAALYGTAVLILWAVAGRPRGGESLLLPIAKATLTRLSRGDSSAG